MANRTTQQMPAKHRERLIFRKQIISAIIVFLLFTITSTAYSQTSTPTSTDSLFSTTQLREDFSILRNALEEGHAGLYRYTSKEEMDRLFDKVYNSITEPLTENEFFFKIAPLVSNVHCGHTRVGLSRAKMIDINNSRITIPFSFEFIEDKTYLVNNYSNLENIKMGGEVISINGILVKDALEKMLQLISSDARINSYKYQYLKRSNNFSRFFALLYGQAESFSIVYKSPADEHEITIEADGITKDEMIQTGSERYPELFSDLPPISTRTENDIPILEIRTFETPAYEQAEISYEQYLADFFTKLHKDNEKYLIIDLRNNDGGEGEYGRILATYLFDKPFYYYRSLRFKNKTYGFWKHTNATQEDWYELMKNGVQNSNGWFDYTEDPGLGVQKFKETSFKGNLYILINGNSFSTTGEFSTVVHYNKRAKFIGTEECGAGYYGNTSGFLPVLNLPNTKLRVSLPLIKYTMEADNFPNEGGLIPDYFIAPTISDILNNEDYEMQFLLKLIGEKM